MDILLVEDDMDIRMVLAEFLTEEGFAIAVAADGADALAQLAATTQPPDLILLDLMMPGMDGVEVSRRLRDDPVTAGIPIVVMSAQDRLRATAALMPIDDRLPKPFALDRLFSTVDRWTRP